MMLKYPFIDYANKLMDFLLHDVPEKQNFLGEKCAFLGEKVFATSGGLEASGFGAFQKCLMIYSPLYDVM